VFQIPIYRAVGSIKMDNGQLIIDNDCVAYGDDFNHFPKENTLIIHYTLSIINSFIGTINRNLLQKSGS